MAVASPAGTSLSPCPVALLGTVVVVEVVDEVVDTELPEVFPGVGATDVDVEPPEASAPAPVPGVVTGTVVVVGTAVTEICCDAAAEAY